MIKCKTQDLKEVLNSFKSLHNLKGDKFVDIEIEFQLQKGYFSLCSESITNHVHCKHRFSKLFKYTLSFKKLYFIINDAQHEETDILFKKNLVTINGVKIECNRLADREHKYNRNITLPVQHTINDVLRLKDLHEEYELRENKLLQKVQNATSQLNVDIEKAQNVLDQYNISITDLHQLVRQKRKS